MPCGQPEVRITFQRALYRTISVPRAELYNLELPDEETVEHVTEQYKTAWAKQETDILAGMQECFGFSFEKNIIDAHIVPKVVPMSSPVLINTRETDPQNFVDVLTHELFHVLFSENNENTSFPEKTMLQRYPEEDGQTRSHVPVHAGLKYIYLDVLNEPDRLETDIQRCKNDLPAGYARAWEIVQENDYTQIIREFSEAAKQ